MSTYGDWSILNAPRIWDASYREDGMPELGAAWALTPNGAFDSGQFGKYSGLTTNLDGTVTAQRLRADKQSDNDYETATYQVVTGPDGQQTLQLQGGWSPAQVDSGWASLLKDVATVAAPVAAFWGIAPQLGGGGSGLLGGSSAATGGDALAAAAGDVGFDAGSNAIWSGAGSSTGAGLFEGAGSYLSPGEMDQMLASQTAAGGGVTAGLAGASPIADAIKKIPSPVTNMASQKLIGGLLGGLLGSAAMPKQGGAGPVTPMGPLPTGLFKPPQWDTVSQGLPNGLGAQSAGLFDQYMQSLMPPTGAKKMIPRKPEQGTGTY